MTEKNPQLKMSIEDILTEKEFKRAQEIEKEDSSPAKKISEELITPNFKRILAKMNSKKAVIFLNPMYAAYFVEYYLMLKQPYPKKSDSHSA